MFPRMASVVQLLLLMARLQGLFSLAIRVMTWWSLSTTNCTMILWGKAWLSTGTVLYAMFHDSIFVCRLMLCATSSYNTTLIMMMAQLWSRNALSVRSKHSWTSMRHFFSQRYLILATLTSIGSRLPTPSTTSNPPRVELTGTTVTWVLNTSTVSVAPLYFTVKLYLSLLLWADLFLDPNDPHKALYDVDNQNTIITLTDWYHESAEKLGSKLVFVMILVWLLTLDKTTGLLARFRSPSPTPTCSMVSSVCLTPPTCLTEYLM
jgi:hypothetical protein